MSYGFPRVQSELHADETWDDNEEEPLPSLRVLTATCQVRRLCSPPLFKFMRRCSYLEDLHVSCLDKTWTGAWQACTRLKNLQLDPVDTDSIQLLTDEFRNGLPNLDSIQINSHEVIPDQKMANMLSA